jgi:hypothetical protein
MRRTPDYLRDQSGTVLPAVIVLALIMLIMTAAVFQFGAQDASLAARDVQSSQALYLAEAGLARAHTWLEAQEDPPVGIATLYPFGADPDSLMEGTYSVEIRPAPGNATAGRKRYTIVSDGASGHKSRTVSLDVATRSFAQYIYFTDLECLPNSSTPVWFCSADYLDGTAHTNGQLHIFGDPTFGGHLSSAHGGPDDGDPSHDPSFMYYNGSFWNHLETAASSNAPYDEPTFEEGYELGTSAVTLPEFVDDLEVLSQNGGTHLDGSYEVVLGRTTALGTLHGYISYRLPYGDWTDVEISSTNGVFFVDGDINIKGTLDGSLTVACSGDVSIADDIVYRDADPVGGPNPGCDDYLGLVAQQNIIIKDNRANSNDCNIHAHMMALDTSFTAEGYDGGSPRGTLTVHGGVIQKYRGAVGTGYLNNGEVIICTGFAKNYHYDTRFDAVQPPGYFVTGEYERLAWREIS